jgi:hypothetical protein
MTRPSDNIPIAKISVQGYRRGGLGNITALVASIRDEGLRHPVILSPGSVLLSGERRIAAYIALGLTQIPAVFVDTLEDFVELITIEMADRTAGLSMRPSELAYHLDVVMSAKLSVPITPHGRQSSELEILAPPYGKAAILISSLLFIHRLAYLAPDPQEREWGHAALDELDVPVGITTVRRKLTERLQKAHPRKRIDYNYVHHAIAEARGNSPATQMSATDQRHAITGSLAMLDGITANLADLGCPHQDISAADREAWARRFESARRTISTTIRRLREGSDG